jgi:uncharacterized protein (DUF1778 family)
MKKKENKIQIRITDEQKAIIKERAEQKNISLTEYIQKYQWKAR